MPLRDISVKRDTVIAPAISALEPLHQHTAWTGLEQDRTAAIKGSWFPDAALDNTFNRKGSAFQSPGERRGGTA